MFVGCDSCPHGVDEQTNKLFLDCSSSWPASVILDIKVFFVSRLVVLIWSGWVGSNKAAKLLQGLLRKPGQQLVGAGPGVHHGKLEEGETTYLKV